MWNLFNVYQQPGWMILGLILISVWVIVWKGLALWFAARNKQKIWFVALLILNTLGLLPIVYLIWFRPKEGKEELIKGVKVAAKETVKKKVTRKKAAKKKIAKKKK